MTSPTPILHVNKTLAHLGGRERYLALLMAELGRRGHESVTMAMADPRNWPSPYADYFVSAVEFPKRVGLSNSLRSARLLARAIYSREALVKTRRLVADTRPQLAHVHSVYNHLSPSVLVALREAGVPILLSAHDYKLLCPTVFLHDGRGICEACKGHRYWQPILHKCSLGSVPRSAGAALEATIHNAFGFYGKKYASRIIVGSQFAMDKHVEFGIERERLRLVPYVLEPDEWPRADSSPGSYLVSAGRLDKGKGIETLLRALRLAGDPPAVIIGRGPMRETLEKLAAELELTNVRFAGYLSEDELRAAVAGALAVVVPSDAYETFGYTVYEAMAAGRPVIASRLGPLPELVTHGETGLLFTPGDASSLAEEIRRMRSDPAAAHRMGAAGRAGFEARNDLDLHYETLLQVYREVAREHTGLTPPTRVGAEMIR